MIVAGMRRIRVNDRVGVIAVDMSGIVSVDMVVAAVFAVEREVDAAGHVRRGERGARRASFSQAS